VLKITLKGAADVSPGQIPIF
jgi:hypothetical protein